MFNCIVDVTPSGVLPKAKPDTTWLPYRVRSPFTHYCFPVLFPLHIPRHHHAVRLLHHDVMSFARLLRRTLLPPPQAAPPPLSRSFSQACFAVLFVLFSSRRRCGPQSFPHRSGQSRAAVHATPSTLTFTQDERNNFENTMIEFQFSLGAPMSDAQH